MSEGLVQNWGCRVFALLFLDREWSVEWILKLAAAKGEGPRVDIMAISKPDDLGDSANLGLSLAEAKRLLAGGSDSGHNELKGNA